MGNRYRTAFCNLFLKERNHTSVTSKYVAESYSYELRRIIMIQCLHDHFAHALRRSHNIRRIYRFIGRDQHKLLYMILSCCRSGLISTKHIILNRLIRTVFHKWHMLMRRRMVDHLRTVFFHDAVDSVCVSDRTNECHQIKFRVFAL